MSRPEYLAEPVMLAIVDFETKEAKDRRTIDLLSLLDEISPRNGVGVFEAALPNYDDVDNSRRKQALVKLLADKSRSVRRRMYARAFEREIYEAELKADQARAREIHRNKKERHAKNM